MIIITTTTIIVLVLVKILIFSITIMSTFVMVKISPVGALSVSLVQKGTPLIAGRSYTLHCQVFLIAY